MERHRTDWIGIEEDEEQGEDICKFHFYDYLLDFSCGIFSYNKHLEIPKHLIKFLIFSIKTLPHCLYYV